MEKLHKITELLGEENEQRIKDSITDLIIEQVRKDLDYTGAYIVDIEEMLEEIQEEVQLELKKKVRSRYMRLADKKFAEIFGNEEGNN